MAHVLALVRKSKNN